jgi:hypothetical protein
MKKVILAFAVLLLIVGCSTPELDDGYQFGDVTRIAIREEKDIKQAINDYCDKAEDSAIRQAALAVIRTKYPFVPENGICG